jgi:hypothetical protein
MKMYGERGGRPPHILTWHKLGMSDQLYAIFPVFSIMLLSTTIPYEFKWSLSFKFSNTKLCMHSLLPKAYYINTHIICFI